MEPINYDDITTTLTIQELQNITSTAMGQIMTEAQTKPDILINEIEDWFKMFKTLPPSLIKEFQALMTNCSIQAKLKDDYKNVLLNSIERLAQFELTCLPMQNNLILLGVVNSGKSTFGNALLGEKVFPISSFIETDKQWKINITSSDTYSIKFDNISTGEPSPKIICFQNKTQMMNVLGNFSRKKSSEYQKSNQVQLGKSIQIDLPHSEFSNFVPNTYIIDTPGFSEVELGDEVKAFIESEYKRSLVVFLIKLDSGKFDLKEINSMMNIYDKTFMSCKRIIFVLTMLENLLRMTLDGEDEVSEDVLMALNANIHDNFINTIRKKYPISPILFFDVKCGNSYVYDKKHLRIEKADSHNINQALMINMKEQSTKFIVNMINDNFQFLNQQFYMKELFETLHVILRELLREIETHYHNNLIRGFIELKVKCKIRSILTEQKKLLLIKCNKFFMDYDKLSKFIKSLFEKCKMNHPKEFEDDSDNKRITISVIKQPVILQFIQSMFLSKMISILCKFMTQINKEYLDIFQEEAKKISNIIKADQPEIFSAQIITQHFLEGKLLETFLNDIESIFKSLNSCWTALNLIFTKKQNEEAYIREVVIKTIKKKSEKLTSILENSIDKLIEILELNTDKLISKLLFNDEKWYVLSEKAANVYNYLNDQKGLLYKHIQKIKADSIKECQEIEKSVKEKFTDEFIQKEEKEFITSSKLVGGMIEQSDEYLRSRYLIQSLLDDSDMKNLFLFFSQQDTVEFGSVFTIIFYFVGISTEQIFTDGKFDWIIAQKFWTFELLYFLNSYHPYGIKREIVYSYAKGNILLEELAKIERNKLVTYSFVLTRLYDFLVLILQIRRDDIVRRHQQKMEMIFAEEKRQKFREKLIADLHKRASHESGFNMEEYLQVWDTNHPAFIISNEKDADFDI